MNIWNISICRRYYSVFSNHSHTKLVIWTKKLSRMWMPLLAATGTQFLKRNRGVKLWSLYSIKQPHWLCLHCAHTPLLLCCILSSIFTLFLGDQFLLFRCCFIMQFVFKIYLIIRRTPSLLLTPTQTHTRVHLWSSLHSFNDRGGVIDFGLSIYPSYINLKTNC